MSNPNITIDIPGTNGGDPTALYHVYSNQCQPQPVFILLKGDTDSEQLEVSADYDCIIGNGVPTSVWNQVHTRIHLPSPAVDPELLAAYLGTPHATSLLSRYKEGHVVEHNGSNFVGHNTDDATDALEELQSALAGVPCLNIQDADDYISVDPLEQLWDPSKQSLAEVSATIEEEARDAEVHLEGSVSDALVSLIMQQMNDASDAYLQRLVDAGEVTPELMRDYAEWRDE